MLFFNRGFIDFLTFPGIMVHEFAHKLFCDLAGIKVYKVRYFRFGNPAGYVIHAAAPGYPEAFLISIAPFLVNTFFALIAFIMATFVPPSQQIIALLLCWLGISIAMHSFPSGQDADNLWQHSKKAWKRNFWALLGFPSALIIKLSNRLSVYWFDLFYAAALLFLVVTSFKG